MNCNFSVRGEPKPQPRPRAFARNMGGGRFAARVYDAGTAEHWKSCVAIAAKPFLPPVPTGEPLRVLIAFYLPRPKGHLNARGEVRPAAPARPVNKMDCDNLAKAVLDALTQIGMWQDDGQIVTLNVSKNYADGQFPAGAAIQIEAA